MKPLPILLLIAAPAAAQVAPGVPAGNPLDPGTAAVGRAESQARLQAQAAARAEAIAAMEPVRPAATPDDGRTRPTGTTFGQAIGTPIGSPAAGSSNASAVSPYMRFGGIRTPWDPR